MDKFQGVSRRKTAVFNGFSTLKEEKGKLCAVNYYSCDCRGGILRRGVGVKPCLQANGDLTPIATALDVNHVFPLRFNDGEGTERELFIAVQSNGDMYIEDADTGNMEKHFRVGVPFHHYAAKTEQGQIMNMFSAPQMVLYTMNMTNFFSCKRELGLSCCIVGGRSFIGMKGRTIQYSHAHAIGTFNESSDGGGKLYLPDGDGEILSLQTDGEYLYAFLKREIYRVKVCADGMDFAVERVKYGGGEICVNSMAETPRGIVFLSLGGVYLLRGNKAQPICRRLAIRPADSDYVCQVGFCEELVLIDYQTLDENGAKAVKRVAISIEDDDGFFCTRMGALGGNDLCVIGGILHQFAKDSADADYAYAPQFTTGKLDFGTRAKKYLKRLRVEGNGKVEILLQGDGGSMRYVFTLKNGGDAARLIMSGRDFVMRIYPRAGAELRSLQIEYVCMESGYAN